MQRGLPLGEYLYVGQALELFVVLQVLGQLRRLRVQLTPNVVHGLTDGGDLADDIVREEMSTQLGESLEELHERKLATTPSKRTAHHNNWGVCK